MRLRDYPPTHTERYVQKGASQKAANLGSPEGKAVETIWAKLSDPKPTMTPPNQIESQPTPPSPRNLSRSLKQHPLWFGTSMVFLFKGAHSKMHIH